MIVPLQISGDTKRKASRPNTPCSSSSNYESRKPGKWLKIYRLDSHWWLKTYLTTDVDASPKTNISLKKDGWKTTFLLKWSLLRGLLLICRGVNFVSSGFLNLGSLIAIRGSVGYLHLRIAQDVGRKFLNCEYPPWTNSSPAKIGHLKRKLVFQSSIFRCYVSCREGICSYIWWHSQRTSHLLFSVYPYR